MYAVYSRTSSVSLVGRLPVTQPNGFAPPVLREIGNSCTMYFCGPFLVLREKRIRGEIKRLPLHNIGRGSSIFIVTDRAFDFPFPFFPFFSSGPFSPRIVQHEPDEYTSRWWLVSSTGCENMVIESSFFLFLSFSSPASYLCLCRDMSRLLRIHGSLLLKFTPLSRHTRIGRSLSVTCKVFVVDE